jgi:hypothetical protein
MDSTSPNIDMLRQLYRQSPIAQAFFDHAARRERDQSETKVDRILILLRAEGHAFLRRDIIALFRTLQDQGCGQFVEGRRGWPSRFVWSAGLTSVGRAAAGESQPIARISPDENIIDQDRSDTDQLDTDLRTETVTEDSDGEEIGAEGGTGIEEEDTGSGSESTQPFDSARIRVDTRPMLISLLMERIKREEIDLTPGFQRKVGIWSPKAKSQLIESLLIRIPLPAFYMDGSDESKWLVVDGLQRLSTLKSFVNDKNLQLTGLEFLGKECNGLKFDQLPRNLRRRILETQVTVFLIQENTPPEVKFNIFKRINTGGLPLSSQEIRHALYQGKACSLLEDLSDCEEFKTAIDNGIRDDRMGDRECILRLLAFMRTSYREYRANDTIDSFLNQCMFDLNRLPDAGIQDLEKRFRRAMVDSYRIFGDRAFRKLKRGTLKKSPINRALFEVWAANLVALSAEDVDRLQAKKGELRERFLSLLEESDFAAAISSGTGDPNKVRLRFSKVNDIIGETLQ